MRTMFSVALLFLVGLSARAADVAADLHLQAIAPYVNDETFLVGHVDVARVDIDLVCSFLEKMGIKGNDIDKTKAVASLAKSTFLKAGGKDIHVLMNWANPLEELLMVVPLGEDAQAGTLTSLMKQIPGVQVQTWNPSSGSALLVAPKKGLARMRGFKAQAVPSLAQAFAAVGDGSAVAVFVPPFALKRAFVELHPVLPKEIGGGNAAALDFQWAVVRLDAATELSAKIVVQAADAKSAQTIGKIIDRAAAFGENSEEVKHFLPDAPKIIASLTPKVNGDQLTLTLSDKVLTSALAPLFSARRMAAGRAVSMNNLKQIGLAMHNYLDTYKTFPAAATYDANGRPLLSWRVYILPYIEQDALFKEFHLDEPWDSEHNKKLITRMPMTYRSPEQKNAEQGKTTYLAPIGAKTIFGGKKGMPIQKITDGTSNTILLVEADDSRAVYWTQPEDYKIDPMNPTAGLVRVVATAFNAAFADGSVRVLPANINPATLRALYTANGGEPITPP